MPYVFWFFILSGISILASYAGEVVDTRDSFDEAAFVQPRIGEILECGSTIVEGDPKVCFATNVC